MTSKKKDAQLMKRKAKVVAAAKTEKEMILDEIRDQINDLVLTSDSFDSLLVSKLMKSLKSCPQEVFEWSYKQIWLKLSQEHSQLRWMCIQLLDELFMRSARVRRFVIRDLKKMVVLCIDPNFDSVRGFEQKYLPAPRTFATLLRNKSIGCLWKWKNNFGKFHKKLTVCWDVLNDNLKEVCDEVVSKLKQLEQYKEDKWRTKLQEIEKKINNAHTSYLDLLDETEMCICQVSHAVQLLLPPSREESENCSTGEDEEKRRTVVENKENTSIIDSLDESMTFLKNRADKKLEDLQKMVELAIKCTSVLKQEDICKRQSSLMSSVCTKEDYSHDVRTKIVQVRTRIQQCLSQVEHINLVRIKSGVNLDHLKVESNEQETNLDEEKQCSDNISDDPCSDVTSSDSDELEDVPEKEGIEYMNVEDLNMATGQQTSNSPTTHNDNNVQFSIPNPSFQQGTSSSQKPQKNPRRKKKKLISKRKVDESPRGKLKRKLKQKRI